MNKNISEILKKVVKVFIFMLTIFGLFTAMLLKQYVSLLLFLIAIFLLTNFGKNKLVTLPKLRYFSIFSFFVLGFSMIEPTSDGTTKDAVPKESIVSNKTDTTSLSTKMKYRKIWAENILDLDLYEIIISYKADSIKGIIFEFSQETSEVFDENRKTFQQKYAKDYLEYTKKMKFQDENISIDIVPFDFWKDKKWSKIRWDVYLGADVYFGRGDKKEKIGTVEKNRGYNPKTQMIEMKGAATQGLRTLREDEYYFLCEQIRDKKPLPKEDEL
jgi:hypothetical protein